MPRQRQRSVQSMDSVSGDIGDVNRTGPLMGGPNPSPITPLPGGPTPNPQPPNAEIGEMMPPDMGRPGSMGGPGMFDGTGPPQPGGPMPPISSFSNMGPQHRMPGPMMGPAGMIPYGSGMMNSKGQMPPHMMPPGGGGGGGKVYPPNQPMVFNPSNPNAPPVYPCGFCHKEVHDNDQAILCESGCNFWFHRPCTGLTEPAYLMLTKEIYAEWACDKCLQTKNIPLVKLKP